MSTPPRNFPALQDPWAYGPADAARYLGVSRDTIINWANEGILPCWITPGGHRRFRKSELDSFVESRRHATDA